MKQAVDAARSPRGHRDQRHRVQHRGQACLNCTAEAAALQSVSGRGSALTTTADCMTTMGAQRGAVGAALLLLLQVAAARAQAPIIISPVIPPAASADLHYDPTLEHVGAGSRPEYAFAYGVEDPKSGNAQSHKEERDGNNVRGEYKVLEADGSVRTVTYTVDPKNGFQANVHQSDPSLSEAYKADVKQAAQKTAVPADDIIGVSEPLSDAISEPISDTISDTISDPAGEYFAGSSYTDFET